MMDEVIWCENLGKDFKVLRTTGGVKGVVQTLFGRDYQIVKAVKDVSFSVKRGEIIGYIGPNGAGKSLYVKLYSCISTFQ
jgi:ABC-2 type transport system ATP-binding protein